MNEKYHFVENNLPNRSFYYIVYDSIQNFLHKMSSSRLFQIYYIVNGNGFYVHENNKTPLSKNNLLAINPFEEFGFLTKENESLTFIGIGMEDIKCEMPKNDQTMIVKSCPTHIGEMFGHIYDLAEKEGGDLELANEYFSVFFKELSPLFYMKEFSCPQSKEEIFVYRVKEYLDSHLLEKITIQKLADQFYCSKSALLHYFKKVEGVSIIEYIQEKRLEQVKFFLRTGERKIADICVDIGFSSTQYFYSYFLKKEGVTPNEYRRLHKNDNN